MLLSFGFDGAAARAALEACGWSVEAAAIAASPININPPLAPLPTHLTSQTQSLCFPLEF